MQGRTARASAPQSDNPHDNENHHHSRRSRRRGHRPRRASAMVHPRRHAPLPPPHHGQARSDGALHLRVDARRPARTAQHRGDAPRRLHRPRRRDSPEPRSRARPMRRRRPSTPPAGTPPRPTAPTPPTPSPTPSSTTPAQSTKKYKIRAALQLRAAPNRLAAKEIHPYHQSFFCRFCLYVFLCRAPAQALLKKY